MEKDDEHLNPHTLQLQYWTEEETVRRRVADMEEEIYRTSQKELHRLLAMFGVFQGVLFSAVVVVQQQPMTRPARGGNNSITGILSTCADAVIPIFLSVVSALAAAMALVHKVYDLSRMRREIARNRSVADSIYGLMESLQAGAIDLNTAEAVSRNPPLYDSEPYCGMDSLLFLVCLTVLMVVSCSAILCRKCDCHSHKQL